MIGRRIAHYEISDRLGEGGMGEVYRATDTKLNRDVAIKLLPEAFAADAQRLARFEREAQVLASLNHPHIGAIYGLEDVGSTKALVLELINGPTLAEHIGTSGLAPEEARGIALQIAEALEAAHEKGVIHRDLKPANVKLTEEGQVKVLDFGLAKATDPENVSSSPDLTHSPTLTMAATSGGVILGTAAYMSPEQARGKPVDRRADIWAFGCVLYEMLTGRQPFAGETLTDTLAAVVSREPDLEAVPAVWRRLIRRCLAKDPSLRLQHIGDARIELLEEETASVEVTDASRQTPFATVAAVAALGLAAGALAAWAWLAAPGAPPSKPIAFAFQTPQPVITLAISPDGRQIALQMDDGQLWLRNVSELELRAAPGTRGAATPFFSPDSRWLGFHRDGHLWRLSLDGGDPVRITPAGDVPGADWGPDGTIVFSPSYTTGLRAVLANGGEARELTVVDREAGEVGHWWPRFLPDGRQVLFSIWTTSGALQQARMGIVDLDSGQVSRIGDGALPRYLRSGHLLFVRAGAYAVAPFDPATATLTGEGRFVELPIRREDPLGDSRRSFSISDDGTLVYLPGEFSRSRSQLVGLDRSGRGSTLPFQSAAFEGVRFSPSGNALSVCAIQEGGYGLWLYDLNRGSVERLGLLANDFNPSWHPGGRALAFTSTRAGSFDVYRLDLEGEKAAVALLTDPLDYVSLDWSPDSKLVLMQHYNPETGTDLWLLEPASGTRRPLAATRHNESWGEFSPDSRWVAYVSTESGRQEVYVRRVDGTGSPIRVSTNGGRDPRWARASNEIFFVDAESMMVSAIRLEGDLLAPGTPRALFPIADYVDEESWDVSEDGRRFIMARRDNPYPTNEVRVVLNWFEDVRRLMGER